MKKMLGEVRDLLGQLSGPEKRGLYLGGLSVFLILFSYPFIRVTTTALFLETHGAQDSPIVWLFSVLALSLAVVIYSKAQERYPMARLYLGTTLFSLAVFVGGYALLRVETYYTTYVLFIWKEVFVMLMLGMTTGLINVSIKTPVAKLIYGPLGAMGSLGGILGGSLTALSSHYIPVESILIIGSLIILCSYFSFSSVTEKPPSASETKNRNPLKALGNAKKYVLLLGLLIIVTQFCINLANFKFNVLFDNLIDGKVAKTQYLAGLYTIVNFLAFIIQIILTPLILHRVSIEKAHRAIPLVYMIINGLPLLFTGQLWPVAVLFIGFKAVDYSLFSAAKEILYFPLKGVQRYGGKYIGDTICYRLGKGLISFVLIYFQTPTFVDRMLWFFLCLWVVILWFLFHTEFFCDAQKKGWTRGKGLK